MNILVPLLKKESPFHLDNQTRWPESHLFHLRLKRRLKQNLPAAKKGGNKLHKTVKIFMGSWIIKIILHAEIQLPNEYHMMFRVLCLLPLERTCKCEKVGIKWNVLWHIDWSMTKATNKAAWQIYTPLCTWTNLQNNTWKWCVVQALDHFQCDSLCSCKIME